MTSPFVTIEPYVAGVVRYALDTLEIVGPFRHSGAWRQLVHRFKYGADLGAGRRLADAMAGVVETDWTCLVPVPRALGRRVRYGLDPSRWLAGELQQRLDIPVAHSLAAGVWWPSRARHGEARPRLRARRWRPPGMLPLGAVLVDDVATTGLTLSTAAHVVGAHRALVASMAIRPETAVARCAYSCPIASRHHSGSETQRLSRRCPGRFVV